jgi:hypothetical protein
VDKSKSKVKAMKIVFFDIRSVIMMNGHLRIKRLIKSTTLHVLGRPDQVPRVSEEEKAGIVEEEIMDSASRQCASSQRPRDEAIFSR